MPRAPRCNAVLSESFCTVSAPQLKTRTRSADRVAAEATSVTTVAARARPCRSSRVDDESKSRSTMERDHAAMRGWLFAKKWVVRRSTHTREIFVLHNLLFFHSLLYRWNCCEIVSALHHRARAGAHAGRMAHRDVPEEPPGHCGFWFSTAVDRYGIITSSCGDQRACAPSVNRRCPAHQCVGAAVGVRR
jgi:hypothetical protein